MTDIAPPTTIAMTSVVVRSEKRSRMMASLCFICLFPCGNPALLERILFHADEVRGVVFGRRMRAAALRVGKLLDARAQHQRRMAIVPFDATRLGVDPVLLIALPRELEL